MTKYDRVPPAGPVGDDPSVFATNNLRHERKAIKIVQCLRHRRKRGLLTLKIHSVRGDLPSRGLSVCLNTRYLYCTRAKVHDIRVNLIRGSEVVWQLLRRDLFCVEIDANRLQCNALRSRRKRDGLEPEASLEEVRLNPSGARDVEGLGIERS